MDDSVDGSSVVSSVDDSVVCSVVEGSSDVDGSEVGGVMVSGSDNVVEIIVVALNGAVVAVESVEVSVVAVFAFVVSVVSSVVGVSVDAVVVASAGRVVVVDFVFASPFSVVVVVESHGSSNHAFVSNLLVSMFIFKFVCSCKKCYGKFANKFYTYLRPV